MNCVNRRERLHNLLHFDDGADNLYTLSEEIA